VEQKQKTVKESTKHTKKGWNKWGKKKNLAFSLWLGSSKLSPLAS
jgi:HKD family nuclease